MDVKVEVIVMITDVVLLEVINDVIAESVVVVLVLGTIVTVGSIVEVTVDVIVAILPE